MTDQITTVYELIEAVAQHEHGSEVMFRGQSRDWPLLPSIGRFNLRSERHPKGLMYQDWQTFHKDIIEKFWRMGLPHFGTAPKLDVEKWIFAQHHGLPTRLLDAALNPLKALHFAVGDPREDNEDGVFWVFNYNSWREELIDNFKEYWDTELTVFVPAQIHPRLNAQEGAFICYPLPDSHEPLQPINEVIGEGRRAIFQLSCMKYIVPGKSKPLLRKQIRSLGAKHSMLFPDLDGVARDILLSLYDEQKDFVARAFMSSNAPNSQD